MRMLRESTAEMAVRTRVRAALTTYGHRTYSLLGFFRAQILISIYQRYLKLKKLGPT